MGRKNKGKKKDQKSGQVRRVERTQITDIELEAKSQIIQEGDGLLKPQTQLVDSSGELLQAPIKTYDNSKEDKMLCVYVPMTWPFTYTNFFENFLRIIHPKHMVILREFGISDYYTHVERKFPICRNRNEAVLKAQKTGADYMLFLDGDMSHPPQIAYMLMRHQYPIVGGMYFHQSPPHLPVIYRHQYDRHYQHYWDFPRNRLFKVDMTGLGCLLVDMRVFDEMTLPYFKYDSTREDGLVDVSEDVEFCEQANKAGHSIMIDPSVQCTHYAMGDVSMMMFDIYMERYRTYDQLIEKFGETQPGEKFDG